MAERIATPRRASFDLNSLRNHRSSPIDIRPSLKATKTRARRPPVESVSSPTGVHVLHAGTFAALSDPFDVFSTPRSLPRLRPPPSPVSPLPPPPPPPPPLSPLPSPRVPSGESWSKEGWDSLFQNIADPAHDLYHAHVYRVLGGQVQPQEDGCRRAHFVNWWVDTFRVEGQPPPELEAFGLISSDEHVRDTRPPQVP